MSIGDRPFFTLTELKQDLNFTDRRALRESLKRNEIPYTEFGREIFIRTLAFVTWLEEHEHRKNSPNRKAG